MRKRFQQSEYLRNATTLIIGVGLAQGIPVLLQFVLRRMYEPEDFGVFAVYFGIVSTFAIIANFRYAHVVVIPKEDDESRNVLAGALILVALFSVFFAIFIWFAGSWCIAKFDFPERLNDWKMLIPVGTFLVSSSLVINSWLTRKKRFKAFAFNKLARRGSEGAVQLMFGRIKYTGGLIVGSLFGDSINYLVSWIQYRRAGGHFQNVNRTSVFKALKRYQGFPLYNLIPTVLDTASLFFPVFVISSFYDSYITGQFDLSRQILALPLVLISTAISQVLLQKLSEQKNNDKPIWPLIRKNFLVLAILALAGIVILYPFAEPIFMFLFGDEYEMAGQMTTTLVFSYALRFAITPLTIMFVAIEKIVISSIWQVCYFAVMLLLLTFRQIDIQEFITYFVIIEVVSYTVYFLLVFFTAMRNDRRLLTK